MTFLTPPSFDELLGITIDGGRLRLLSQLGEGAFGRVLLAEDLRSEVPMMYAVKALLSDAFRSPQQAHFLKSEIQLHRRVSSHRSIVTLHRVITTPTFVFLVLDLVSGSDLFDAIVDDKVFLGQNALMGRVFLQIVEAVAHLHEKGVAHRDLKPENILCSEGGETVFLADFGLASATKDSIEFACGSSFYMSPECRNSLFEPFNSYNIFSNDIWALGVLLVTIICGVNPWREASLNDESFISFLRDPHAFLSAFAISLEARQLLLDIFHINSSERINIGGVVARVKEISRWSMVDATESSFEFEDNINNDTEQPSALGLNFPGNRPPTTKLIFAISPPPLQHVQNPADLLPDSPLSYNPIDSPAPSFGHSTISTPSSRSSSSVGLHDPLGFNLSDDDDDTAGLVDLIARSPFPCPPVALSPILRPKDGVVNRQRREPAEDYFGNGVSIQHRGGEKVTRTVALIEKVVDERVGRWRSCTA